MNKGDLYRHFKGVEYCYDCIALPLKVDEDSKEKVKKISYKTARYHEDTHDINLYLINGIIFIESDVPHVIYQSEKHYGTDFVFAREVDDFFGYKHITGGHYVKRFTLKR